MKNTSLVSRVILLILSIFLIHSCKKDKPAPPTITTTAVTEISYTTATSGGDVTNDGGTAMVLRGVCWNTSADPTIADNKTTDRFINDPAGGLGSFINYITLLTPNTMYYLRAYATNSVGIAYGNQVSFTTLKVELPVLTTTVISSVSQTTAISGGNITADNGGSVTARGVCWSTSANPTIELTTKTTNNTGTGVFASSITGLSAGTTYYVRAYATNSEGTGYGNEIFFTTNPPTPPVIATNEVSSITTTTAVSGGNVTDDGGAAVTFLGVCWSTSLNPTTANNITIDNSTGSGSYTSTLTGLTPNTTYYLRAYATNSAGTGYGNELILTTKFILTDIDGNTYNYVTIGSQIWMAENLKTTKYSNGDLIGTTSPATLDISGEATPKYQWAYDGNESNVNTYGRLYTWYTGTDIRNVCPIGWHVPSFAEWDLLRIYARNSNGTLKETGTTHWQSPNTGATNESGFTALPGGYRSTNGIFSLMGFSGRWLSTSVYTSDATKDYGVGFNYDSSIYYYMISIKQTSYSVRCLKDN